MGLHPAQPRYDAMELTLCPLGNFLVFCNNFRPQTRILPSLQVSQTGTPKFFLVRHPILFHSDPPRIHPPSPSNRRSTHSPHSSPHRWRLRRSRGQSISRQPHSRRPRLRPPSHRHRSMAVRLRSRTHPMHSYLGPMHSHARRSQFSAPHFHSLGQCFRLPTLTLQLFPVPPQLQGTSVQLC
jgi:hypothetical protein